MRFPMAATPLLLLLSLVVNHATATTSASTASSATTMTCSAPGKTLTFECDDQCSSKYSPCWHNATLPATAATCNYECYSIYYSDNSQTNFVFLVPYGAWKSAQQIATGDTSSDVVSITSTTDDMGKYIFKSNDYLTSIDALVLPSTVTTVSISGGSYFKSNIVKGRVSNVELADDFLTKQTKVQSVYFGNLNLEPMHKRFTTMLPLTIQELDFNNGLLTTFPTDFAKFTMLQKLSLTNNYIKTVDASMAIDTISLLAVNLNNIVTFDAVFKNATLVALSGNNLTELPSVFAQYPRLETLYLDHNNITVVEESHAVESVKTLYLGMNQITKFNAVFPSLKWLDLQGNNLTEIPDAVFKHTSLANLQLTGNPLKNITLTNAQAAFLNNLKNLTFDGTVYKDCFVYEQKEVQGTKFCISDVNADNSGGGGSGSSIGIIIGIVCAVLVVGGVVAFFCVRKRRNKQRIETYQGSLQSQGTSNGTGNSTTSLWNDAALLSVKVQAEDVEDIKLIGKGAYGDVWLVKYRKTRLLASKRLRKGEISQSRTQNFIDEIKLVAKLEHPKIVQFIGAAWTIEADLQALFEYMEGDDLRVYLDSPRTSRSWTHEKLQIAIDIVEALVYVHSFNPPLVHRDIKSRNVLLSAELEAKLTDFGASRYRSEENTMTAGIGTGKWLAPEVISGSNDYGPPADIFSFGAVLTELDSHLLPYDGVRGSNGNKLVDVALLQKVSLGQITPSFTESCPEKIVEIGSRCFAFNPVNRPTAAEIAYALRQIKKAMYTLV